MSVVNNFSTIFCFQIESALRDIIVELKKLPTCLTNADLAPGTSPYDVAGTSSMDLTPVTPEPDLYSDIYTVIEGSVLIPFIEVRLLNTFVLEQK